MTTHTQTDAAWQDALDRALQDANYPTLLMVLIHLTGDERWLAERYRCSRIRGLEDNDSGDLPDEVRLLMRLYPQPRNRRPSVEYIPMPYDGQERRARPSHAVPRNQNPLPHRK